jgi:transcriptional regulator with XRE-family HTH domain
MGQIERGVGVPSLQTLSKVADAFRIPLKELFDSPASPQSSDFLVREASFLLERRSKRERQRAIHILRALFKP